MSREIVHVFLDTNTALHFRRADQIDWLDLTSAPQVVLVVAPVFLRELEQQKIHNPSRKLRQRADKAVKWLAQFLRTSLPPPVRQGVTLKFLSSEPQIDFSVHRLSPSIADDQLIASALEYQASTRQTVFVTTADLGLEAKLHSRSVRPLVLPEKLKLPAEPDPVEKELRETKQQLQRLESRLPDLWLAFEDRTNQFKFSLPTVGATPNAPTLEEIQTRHPSLSTSTKYLPGFQINQDHNQKLLKFYDAYSAFLEDLAAWNEPNARTVKVDLVMSNRGSAPASDIHAILQFPDDLQLFADVKKLPKRPVPPDPPRRPGEGLFQRLVPTPNLDVLDPFDYGPRVERNRLIFSQDRLKHRFDEPLPPFYFRFPDRDAIRSFKIRFELSAAELADATSGMLHLVAPTD